MARARFRRKDLKRPDEFVSRGRQLIEWATTHGRLVSWVAGGIVLIVVVVAGFFSVRGARIRQANEDLSHALADFHGGQYRRAATQLADVASRWQSTTAGRVAGLYAANADLHTDDVETAAALLQDALATRDWPPYLHQQALVVLGYALERKADVQGAAGRYAEAAAAEGPYTPLAILSEARCREQAGEKDKARALYERFKRAYPEAPEKEIVAGKLDELAG